MKEFQRIHQIIRCFAWLTLISLAQFSDAQSCLPGGINLTTQGQIDSFPYNYPGCIEIIGSFRVQDLNNGNITNLDSLIQIKTITGALFIENCNQLVDLDGLDSLNSLGSLLKLDDNLILSSISGLSGLNTIPGRLQITNQDALTNLFGLDSITSIGGNLYIEENPLLTNLSALNNLSSINGSLRISHNTSLISLTGLEKLLSINGNLVITHNVSLLSLDGLESIDYTSITDLDIRNCDLLTFCSIENICNFISSEYGYYIIDNNSLGCNLPSEVISICNGCPSNGIAFFSQNQIDSFPFNYPNCNLVLGDILINETTPGNIKNIDSLIQIEIINGSLTINENDSLSTLEGLSMLSIISGELAVSNNPSLTSLAGIETINEGTISNLIIENCSNLSICALENICSYLNTSEYPASVFGNALGCETRTQVITYCTDTDNDGVIDSLDNCISIFNPSQEDSNNNGIGDICDYSSEDGIGIGTDNPLTKLHIAGGVTFADNNNGSLLMKSSDDSCWILKVSNDGELSVTKVPCPE